MGKGLACLRLEGEGEIILCEEGFTVRVGSNVIQVVISTVEETLQGVVIAEVIVMEQHQFLYTCVEKRCRCR